MMAFRTLRWKCALLAPMCLMVLGAARQAAADTITVGWDQSSSTVGYRVHVGVQSGSYSQHFDVGSATNFAFTTATAGQRYCFAVSAYMLSTRLEGPNSNEVCGYSDAPPTLLNPGARQSTVGQPTSLQLQGSDPQSQPLTYSATGLPPGLSVMSSTGYISGTGTSAGTYTVTARASDGVLSASQTFTWTMSTSSTSSGGTTTPTAPTGCPTVTVSICSPTTEASFSTTQSSITLTGSASPAITRVVWENVANGARGVASGTTSWAIANIPLVAGNNYIEITAYDSAGNPSIDRLLVTRSSTTSSGSGGTTTTPPPSTSGPDSIGPTVTIASPTSASTYSINASSITLSGTASDNVGVTQVRWEVGASTLSGVASGLTNWSASVPLRVGSNVIYIVATDAAGNRAVDVITVTVSSTGTGSTGGTTTDTTAPTVSINTPTTGSTYATTQSTINMTGTASDNRGLSQVTWMNSLGGSGVASGTTSWSIASIPLQVGTNVITVTAVDSSGNRTIDSLSVTRSSTTSSTGSTGCAATSTVSICTPTTGTSFTTTQSSINMTGTAPSVITRVVWENIGNGARGVASGTTSWAIANIPLVVGSNWIEVTAYDGAGNPSTDRLLVTR